MDGIEKYFLMCEKAIEIQEIWRNALSSRVEIREFKGSLILGTVNSWTDYKWIVYLSDDEIIEKYKISEDIIWLPRQDQLQEMLKATHLTNPYNLIGFLWNILNEDETCPEEMPCKECIKEAMYWHSFETLEQLWLAFIMYELYDNKIWNGIDWIID